ncbi:hypothetical protein J40TS1_38240 [Paenibacillus montaniterrae]|uniref:Uncharacterized protein n=1 Tax=Paenibacillus montaniterrae TaxID=429341 RepID=A0A919YPD7_9BACL|nr:carbohydrate binding domain-containing protein [Paenibacillus montaniterrae]GIP18182.1 hypothetical protein J40TS1_38240 [Paenibacillus montaniterrae]
MKRQSIIWLLILTILLPSTIYGAESDKEREHWGATIMSEWHAKGMISGYPDGSLRPDEPITRAQFARLLHAVFQFSTAETGSVSFQDVQASDWFYNDVAAVLKAGIVQGYPDGSFKPNASVNRQDAAKMLAAAYKLAAVERESGLLAQYSDGHTVSGYARQSLESLLDQGAITGFPDGTIKPLKALTRAEAVTLLDRLSGQIIQEAGTYRGLTIEGNLVINTAGVALDHVKVTGNVYVTAGVGEGELQLSNAEIAGVLHINGGGSIDLKRASVQSLAVNKIAGKARVAISDQSHIEQLNVESDASIELDKESIIGTLAFMRGAEGSELKSTGKIEQLVNEAGIKLPDQQGGGDGTSSGGSGTTPAPTAPPQPTSPPAQQEWKLVWSDEFDGSGTNLDENGVDLDKWGYQLGTGAQYGLDGWGNNEQQYYRAENIAVEDGLLKITAKQEQYEGKPYTSGRLFTEPTFSQTYGKFEARIKLPAGEGLWPAFWMMPQDSDYGTWAASGEIDIMEARGRLLNEIGGALHYGRSWPNNKSAAKAYHFPEGEDITDFHIYGIEWEPGEIRWYVDGKLFQTINNWDSWGDGQPAKYAFPAPFDKPFYMILNLAVGGNYDGGRTPAASELPAEMLVDYVRVYDLVGRPYRQVEEPSIEVEPIAEPYKQAINGSYVYDAGYEQPITTITESAQPFDEDYWNFVYLDQFGGEGKLSIDTIDGTRFAKADIAQMGREVHSLQLIQHVTVGKGRWYKLSFDAKSQASRNMTVKIGGGESRGWSVYSENYEVPLTDSVQSYDMIFQMTADTDKQARLEFNMGLNQHAVWIGNVKLEQIEAPDPYNEEADKEPLADGNHIYNGSFDLGYIHRLTYWKLDTAGNAIAQLSVNPQQRELHASIINGGKQASDLALLQKGVSLVAGNDYELTFAARADQPRTIEAALLGGDGSLYGSAQSVTLNEQMKGYTVSFTVDAAAADSGQLAFWLGGAEGSIYLDDVKLVRTTNNSVGELPLELQFPLKNGDFSNGLNGWSEHVQGRYDGWDQQTGIEHVNGELLYTIASTGNNPWDVMLSQADLPLKKNQTYVISLDAKASQAREMEIVLETASYQRFVSERVALTTEWQSFSYELPVDQDAQLSFKLLLGKLEQAAEIGEHTVSIDNVRVEVKDARSKAFLAVNGSFDYGMEGWHTHVQGVYDGDSKASFTADSKALHASVEHAGANPWDIVLFQDAAALQKGKTYVVTFAARASTARTIDVVVENSAYVRSLNEQAKLTEEVQQISYEFTMASDEQAQLKFLLGKQADDAGEAHHVYIDNVRFELKDARAAAGELASEEHNLDAAQ